MHFFLAKSHVSVPFSGPFLPELNEICCASLLTSILKTDISLTHILIIFYSTKSEVLSNLPNDIFRFRPFMLY